MKLDLETVKDLTRRIRFDNYVRLMPIAHHNTPLGMGYGESRFSDGSNFKVLYVAQDMKTSILEAFLRDRFEGKTRRTVRRGWLDEWAVTTVKTVQPLRLLDLRTDGAFLLGVSTDVARAKSHRQSRKLAEEVYDKDSNVDGIIYPSRFTSGQCVAVFDRAVGKLVSLTNPALDLRSYPGIEDIFRAYRITISDN